MREVGQKKLLYCVPYLYTDFFNTLRNTDTACTDKSLRIGYGKKG